MAFPGAAAKRAPQHGLMELANSAENRLSSGKCFFRALVLDNASP
eukprot:CAMPEP_0168480188 /NCGR_PEP_ID=MMETSP0228-20121227/63862_1 /TAXON_ID=133427 /ORGANISM="Protoceratium reticulatum, Strain CCCM 535 (=CCMP 1889)" /LENGTH=44 /DNA_ID= /DNA_START= /DNA_END= /DNA_ORIENTATION=